LNKITTLQKNPFKINFKLFVVTINNLLGYFCVHFFAHTINIFYSKIPWQTYTGTHSSITIFSCLGLVISKLAEQSASGKAAKEGQNFIPYRDSILTWLLKDSLGGNSRTIMLATLSPAEDNFEETLSTLRYADRAKRITNHAVVNEDPNARLIRELKAEVERLKSMLLQSSTNAQLSPSQVVLQDATSVRLAEEMAATEQLMEAMSLTRDQKLALTERRQEERRQQLESLVGNNEEAPQAESSGYFVVNLNADPSLSGLLVYHLKSMTTKVGRSGNNQDIQLEGVGIRPEHCILTIDENDKTVWLEPLPEARSCVNGQHVTSKTELHHGDRLLWGANHFFRVHFQCKEDSGEPLLDWNAAQEELLREQGSKGQGLDDMITKLEEKYEREKRAALDRQRTEYEKQLKRMTNNMDGAENANGHFDERLDVDADDNVMSWLEDSTDAERMDKFKKSLAVLRQSLIRSNIMAREANQMAEELERATKFSVSLQIPSENLTPNCRNGAFMTQPSILVSREGEGRQVWPLERLESRLADMRELTAKVADQKVAIKDIGETVLDPFYDAVESHTLIGVANFYLSCLFHGVAFEYYAPIISQNGTVAGKLLVEIQKLAGSFPADRIGHCSDKDSENNSGEDNNSLSSSSKNNNNTSRASNTITVGIKIKAVVGLPPALAHFVFCEYRFWGDTGYTVVPTLLEPRGMRSRKADTVDFKFDHCRTIQVQYFLPI
jgi:kinesin family member 13